MTKPTKKPKPKTPSPVFKLEVTGHRNPAEAALVLARQTGLPYNEASFLKVAKAVGNLPPSDLKKHGFVMNVCSLVDGLEQLCEAGKFGILLNKAGELECCLISKWPKHLLPKTLAQVNAGKKRKLVHG